MYLGISMALSFISAILFVIVLTLTLPESDLAHGDMPFSHPLVFPAMVIWATIFGFSGWPFFYFLGRREDPRVVANITGSVVLGTIIIGTPFHPAFGFPGSCLAGIFALIYCFIRSRNKKCEQDPSNH